MVLFCHILSKYSFINRELEVLASGIKRDGHKKFFANQEIRELGGTTVPVKRKREIDEKLVLVAAYWTLKVRI